MVVRGVACIVVLVVIGCGPGGLGGGTMLNMQPTPPHFAGAYDFELLARARGHACRTQRESVTTSATRWWFAGAGTEQIAKDPLAAAVISAAVFDAIDKSENADSLVVTRVEFDSSSTDQTCATVYGRGVRLTKAKPPAPSHASPAASSPVHDDDDDRDDRDDQGDHKSTKPTTDDPFQDRW